MNNLDKLTNLDLLKDILEGAVAEMTYTAKEAKSIRDKIIELEALNKKKVKTDEEKGQLSKKKGEVFEGIVKEVFLFKRLYKVKQNVRTSTNEIDLLITPTNTLNCVLTNCFGRFTTKPIVLECKNYSDNVGVTWVGKFANLLSQSDSKVGILISLNSLGGKGKWDSAKGLVKKTFLREKVFIIHFSLDEFKNLEGKNMIDLLLLKMDSLTFDVDYPKLEDHELKDRYNFD